MDSAADQVNEVIREVAAQLGVAADSLGSVLGDVLPQYAAMMAIKGFATAVGLFALGIGLWWAFGKARAYYQKDVDKAEEEAEASRERSVFGEVPWPNREKVKEAEFGRDVMAVCRAAFPMIVAYLGYMCAEEAVRWIVTPYGMAAQIVLDKLGS